MRPPHNPFPDRGVHTYDMTRPMHDPRYTLPHGDYTAIVVRVTFCTDSAGQSPDGLMIDELDYRIDTPHCHGWTYRLHAWDPGITQARLREAAEARRFTFTKEAVHG